MFAANQVRINGLICFLIRSNLTFFTIFYKTLISIELSILVCKNYEKLVVLGRKREFWGTICWPAISQSPVVIIAKLLYILVAVRT